MTRRERLERKIEKRREWADKAESRANSLSQQSHDMMSVIPMGQPIIVGHYSEKRDRAYRERAWNKMGRAVEQRDLAEHHDAKASGLEMQLDRAIFSDDDNAIEALEARIAEHEAERERMKLVNKLYKKADIDGLKTLGLDYESIKQKLASLGSYFGQAPHMPYELSNLGGRITADRKRLEVIKAQQQRAAAAEAAPNGVTVEDCSGGYVRVTFAEKPDRGILDALRAAGFWWGKGSWAGLRDKLPTKVKEMLEPKPADGDQHTEPTYENQLYHARKLLAEKGCQELRNPHAAIGATCGCGTCFCCAAAQVIREHEEARKTEHCAYCVPAA